MSGEPDKPEEPPKDDDTPEPREQTPGAYPPTKSEENEQKDDPDLPGTGGLGKFLTRILSRSYFIDLHIKVGQPSSHKYRAWFAFMLDVIVRLVVLTILLGIALAVAYKTLVPLPRWRTP